MHQPRPYGLHVIGLPLTDKDEAFIGSVAKRITNLKELSKVDSIKMVYDLPDGGYVIVQDMGSNFRVIAHKPELIKDMLASGIATYYIPMLYSGVITNAIALKGHGVGLRLTDATLLRLAGYDINKTSKEKEVQLRRFVVEYDGRFGELKPLNPSSSLVVTQYAQLRPTWYSGAMAEVVQIIGGYGRQDINNLPAGEFEQAQFVLPKTIEDKIKDEMGAYRLPGYTGMPSRDGGIKYDYKFNNTNSIGFDDKNKPWLLNIDSSGVWAMPLPIIPATTTPTFKAYIAEMGDEEVLKVVDRFGGLPSGEAFPTGRAFQAWRRAGVVIKVCDTSDFYSHITYSSACGWAVNDRGTEGYNTCYDYMDDDGIGLGFTYKLSLALKNTIDYKGSLLRDYDNSNYQQAVVSAYMRSLVSVVNKGTEEDRAILYKISRSSVADIYSRAIVTEGKDDYAYWDNLEHAPISKHEGRVSEVYRGYLYHFLDKKFQPQIKFPEPLLGGCVSHDFLPLSGRNRQNPPNSDTIMFAYYIGDSLNVVKYFVNWDSMIRGSEDNFERDMTVGNWSGKEYIGSTKIQGFFYTTDIDERELIAIRETNTTIVGADKGYGGKPKFGYDGLFHMCGTMYRDRYYTHQKTIVTDSGKTLDIAICIPYLGRSSIISAKKTTISSQTTVKSLDLLSRRDPTSYRYYTFDFGLAYLSMTIKNPKGRPEPWDGYPVWVEEIRYQPYDGSDFADNGPWLPALPYDATSIVNPDGNTWVQNFGGENPTADVYRISTEQQSVTTGNIKVSLLSPSTVLRSVVADYGHFETSPNEVGTVFYREMSAVVFGDSDYRSVSEPDERSARAYKGYSKLADSKSAHHFIGVINE